MSQTPPWPDGQQPASPPPANPWGAPSQYGQPVAGPGLGPVPDAGASPAGVPAVPAVPQMAPPAPQAPLGQSAYGQRPVPAPYQQGQPGQPGQGNFGQFTFPVIEKQKFEPLAVAGVATSPLGVTGIVLGFLARGRVKQTRRRSMALAWAGIGLGALFTVGWVLLAVTLALNGTIDRALERPQAGDASEPRTIASANLAVGNCVSVLPPAESVGEVRVVPCAQEHIAQVISLEEIYAGSYLGAEETASRAIESCTAALEDLGETDPPVEPWYLAPSEEGWNQGNHTVVCLARGSAGPSTSDLVN